MKAGIDRRKESSTKVSMFSRVAAMSSRYRFVLVSRAQIAAGIKGSEPFASIAKQLMSAGCASPADCAAIAVLIGDLMANRGEWGAGTYYARSTREEPTEARWLKLAQAAERVGAYVQVADALEKVGQLRGKKDPDLRQRIDENRAKAVHKLVDR